MAKKVIASYKGFEKDLSCRGFQYEIGKEYKQDGKIIPCNNGFHACENPLDVLDYYNKIDNRFCEVEQSGTTVKKKDKTVSSNIKIKAEIGFDGLFKAGIEYLKKLTILDKVVKGAKDASAESGDDVQIGSSGDYAKIGSSGDLAQIGSSGDFAKIGSSGNRAQIGSSGDFAQIGSSGDDAQIGSSGDLAQIGSSGDYAKIGSSGNRAQIGSSGNHAKIGSSGNFAKISSTGKGSVICCAGNNSCVKAKQGSWITLSEWEYSKEKNQFVPKCVKTEFVDGKRIKEDTWYRLQNGEFKEVVE